MTLCQPAECRTYSYDERNRLDLVKLNGQLQADYDYDSLSRLTRTTFGNGTQESRSYDSLSHLKELSTKRLSDNIQLSKYVYSLDNVGNRKTVTETVNGQMRSIAYNYDDLYRLTSEVIADTINGNRTSAYAYDKVGNRQTKTINGITTTYTYDANDRLLHETVNSLVTASYGYDNNGSTLSKTENGVTTSYVWNDEKRLVRATVGMSQVEYVYNDQGIRVSSKENGVETRYLLDEGITANVWEEYASTGTVQGTYVYGNDLIAQIQVGQMSYYLVDGLGSTRLLTDGLGQVLNSYGYEAFGETISQSGSAGNKYQFAGEQFDSALGDYYLRQRFYDTSSGRFGRMDTYEGLVEEPLSFHKYIYANINPVVFRDPSGFISIGGSAGGGLGDATGALMILAILATIGAITYTATLENTREKVCRYEIDEDHIFYPDTRSGSLEGFHSTAVTEMGYDYEWLDERQIPSTAWTHPYEAVYYLPGNPTVLKKSSFFPESMNKKDVIEAIGEAYIKSGCKPSGDWDATITLPGANVRATVTGYVRPIGNIHFITTAYPSI
jgi:RHS repeat-associated protein